MGYAVDTEGNVERDAEAAIEVDPEWVPERLLPEVPRHSYWYRYHK